MDEAALRNEIATATGETSAIEFKSFFDATQDSQWLGLLKDVIAIHNSGGGAIVFGLESDGSRAPQPCGIQGRCDPAHLMDKIRKYTERPKIDVRFADVEKAGGVYCAWFIGAAEVPIPFAQPGTYALPNQKQESAFRKGDLYFRHGAKSEHVHYDDLVAMRDRVDRKERERLLQGVRTVTEAPRDHVIAALPAGVQVSNPGAPTAHFRITDRADALDAVQLDRYTIYPHRQTEVLQQLATRLPGVKFNSADLLSVRRAYGNEIQKRGFVWKPPRNSPQYSDEFVDWIAERLVNEPEFLAAARRDARAAMAARN